MIERTVKFDNMPIYIYFFNLVHPLAQGNKGMLHKRKKEKKPLALHRGIFVHLIRRISSVS